MNDTWPWQKPEVAAAIGTVAVCAIVAWAGGIVGSEPGSTETAARPIEQEPAVDATPVASDASAPAEAAGTMDLVGMVVRDERASGGFVLMTSYDRAFALDMGNAADAYDPAASLEWHVVAEVSGTDEGTALTSASAVSIRPFNEMIERIVEVPVAVRVEVPAVQAPAETQPQQPVEAPPVSPTLVTLEGTIDSEWMAIGGETTGVALRDAANQITELDLSAVIEVYRSTDNRAFVNWVATGVLEERVYTTRGVVPTLRVTELRTGGS